MNSTPTVPRSLLGSEPQKLVQILSLLHHISLGILTRCRLRGAAELLSQPSQTPEGFPGVEDQQDE